MSNSHSPCSADIEYAPEVWVDCPECGGEGEIEHPRPFWDDPYYCEVVPCRACNATGGMICEAEGRPAHG
jgi:DnaJ-class molecular chaperone